MPISWQIKKCIIQNHLYGHAGYQCRPTKMLKHLNTIFCDVTKRTVKTKVHAATVKVAFSMAESL